MSDAKPDPGMWQLLQRCREEYEQLGCRLWYVDNPHPCWFGSRPLHKTATGMSEEAELSPYTTAESRHMKTKFYPQYKLVDNEHMYRGRGQELHILRTFCERMGYRLLQVALLVSMYDVRLAATPDGLAMVMVIKPDGSIWLLLWDLEAKCPIKEVLLPPLMYLAQMAAQLEVTELSKAFLVTHSEGGHGRCWTEHRSTEFFGWLRRCAHRGLQYDACGVSHMGREWSTRGLRGFLRDSRAQGPDRPVHKPNVEGLYERTNAELERRLEREEEGQSSLRDYFARPLLRKDWPEKYAPLPLVQRAAEYEVPLLDLPEFNPQPTAPRINPQNQ